MSKNGGAQPTSPSFDKATRDNRANQLNPNNPAYHTSRGQAPPTGKPGSTGKGR